jgi:hypothetical protein
MFSAATNTINGVSQSSATVSVNSSSTNKSGIFGIGGSNRSIYQTESYKAYRAAEDAAWAKLTTWGKVCSFFHND